MKIDSVRIQNFRCFEDETVYFNDYTCLVGANGSGKSTVLTALCVFFRDTASSPTDLLNLQEQDFYRNDTSKEVIITATLSGLDAEAKDDFEHYARQEKLIVSAVARWNPEARMAEVKQYGQRLVFKPFTEFFLAEGSKATVTDLRQIYRKLGESFPELPPPASKQQMIDALRNYESRRPELCELERSEDQFYGFTKGANRLRKHLEWVFVPAVKDASAEQLEAKKTALGLLLERTVRSKMSFSDTLRDLRNEVESKYAEILEAQQNALKELSGTLTKRLREWAHPDAGLAINWRSDPLRNISIQEPQAEVLALDGKLQLTISRMGHGLQRSFLLALLQELSGCPNTGKPKLLLACEEPELYQHPPQIRHLSSVLQELSGSNAQVMVSTHSPLLISSRGFTDVRLFRREVIDDQPRVCALTFQELSRTLRDARGEEVPGPTATEFKVEQILQPRLNEMFFTPVLVLVEGDEDLGYIEAYLELSGRYEEFRRLGCHIVPTSGKGKMVYPLGIANAMDIPAFAVFDADGDEDDPSRRAQHTQDNTALLRLSGIADPDPFPAEIFPTGTVLVWPTKIAQAVQEDLGQELWEEHAAAVRKKHRLFDLGNSGKSALFIGLVLTSAYEAGARSRNLETLCDRIISFAREKRASTTAKAAPAPEEEGPKSG